MSVNNCGISKLATRAFAGLFKKRSPTIYGVVGKISKSEPLEGKDFLHSRTIHIKTRPSLVNSRGGVEGIIVLHVT